MKRKAVLCIYLPLFKCIYMYFSIRMGVYVYMYIHILSDLIHMRPYLHVLMHMYASTRVRIFLCACVHIPT